MLDEPSPEHNVRIPALMRAARGAYTWSVRDALSKVRCSDLPQNGSYMVAAISRDGSPLSEIISQLGISKQAASQLVEMMVGRGYLDRTPDPKDRRRVAVTLTKKGRTAASAVKLGIERVDAELFARVGDEYVDHAKTVLSVLIKIGQDRDVPLPGSMSQS